MKTILLSDIIRNQAILNVGCVGHVSNGKSTLVKQMTGIKTQKFKSEKEIINPYKKEINIKIMRLFLSG